MTGNGRVAPSIHGRSKEEAGSLDVDVPKFQAQLETPRFLVKRLTAPLVDAFLSRLAKLQAHEATDFCHVVNGEEGENGTHAVSRKASERPTGLMEDLDSLASLLGALAR